MNNILKRNKVLGYPNLISHFTD